MVRCLPTSGVGTSTSIGLGLVGHNPGRELRPLRCSLSTANRCSQRTPDEYPQISSQEIFDSSLRPPILGSRRARDTGVRRRAPRRFRRLGRFRDDARQAVRFKAHHPTDLSRRRLYVHLAYQDPKRIARHSCRVQEMHLPSASGSSNSERQRLRSKRGPMNRSLIQPTRPPTIVRISFMYPWSLMIFTTAPRHLRPWSARPSPLTCPTTPPWRF